MTAYDDCIRSLDEIGGMSLRFRPKTKAPIQTLRVAMDMAAALPPEQFAALRATITQALSFKLMYLGALAAEEAINSRDPDWIRVSLLVHVLESFKFDYRENFLWLYATEYAAWRIGVDVRDTLRSCERLMTDVAKKLFADLFVVPHGEMALRLSNLSIIEVEGETRFAPAEQG